MRTMALALTAGSLLAAVVTPSFAQQGAQRTAPADANRVQSTLHEAAGPGVNAHGVNPLTRGVGTIMFDNNVPFQRDGQDDGLIGNRFSPPGTHSINSVSFRVAGNYISAGTTGSVVVTVWGVDGGAGTAQVLQRQIVNGVPGLPFGGTGTITNMTVQAPLTAPVVGQTGSFIAGVRNTFYDGCGGNTALNSTCDGVALTEGTADPGLGFNAARLLFTGPFNPTSVTQVSSTGVDIANRNAIFRATGDNLPVELMQFEID